jgi:uncharacterized membrane protein
MTEPNGGQVFVAGTDRLRNFSDGVFAIVITLLILELKTPQLRDPTSGADLVREILKLWPKLLSYVISFFMVGIYWVGHRNIFEAVHRADRTLLWLNNLFLLGVSFLPYPAAILGQYNANAMALTIYGANLACISLFLYALFSYAVRRQHLLAAQLPPGLVSAGHFIILMPFVFYGLAAGAAFLQPKLSLVIFTALPVLYVSPGTLEAVVRWRARLEVGAPG